MTDKNTEIAGRAEFDIIRYAQVWEDADVLLDALAIQPGDRCLSIASAGDNAIAMLLGDPEKVIAVDLNPSQLACLELRVAAYRHLSHPEFLMLMGSRPCSDRRALYDKCKGDLSEDVHRFWETNLELVDSGIGSAGKFERYFKLFREKIIPWIHSGKRVDALLRGGTPDECRQFYDRTWNNWRWRLLFRVFFSRFVMGRMGRDPEFFKYVEENQTVIRKICQNV